MSVRWLRGMRIGLALAPGLVGSLTGPAAAQGAGCTLAPRTDPPPPRQVLTCGDGLTIAAETGAALTVIDRNRDGRPDAVTLDAKAVLVDRPPGAGRFQILTPHAVASVRGTIWAVDVSADQTSVFVEQGRVAVSRPRGRPVVLGAGDGVDVRPGTDPLTVTRWGAARVAALLGRLGR
ncbi:FecR domain-containing protein [Methylobacterium nonmethylotrophicum]|uniref:Iron dicitrate transport regulator FecR n=1 Tax=Methylobacterium nonmethylotrophicum TaxID=1141884 RepID=A0A4Z0NPM8_9HYPH|nr:FecR domain-containing protein [Methylobacterium nonmethylotrophicum]TGD97959.1 iron dicitrate transport regulator FecR [Methylobacterium nonmethylotrophicum]